MDLDGKLLVLKTINSTRVKIYLLISVLCTLILISYLTYQNIDLTPNKTIKISNKKCREQDPGLKKSNTNLNFQRNKNSIRFAVLGDYGKPGDCELAVSNLVKSFTPDFIITAGDNFYNGPQNIDESIGKYYHQYIGDYTGSFGSGSHINKFFPTIGNHDHEKGNISAYLEYFKLPGVGKSSSGNERYYDFVQGPVHFFAVNSTKKTEPDGISKTSNQAEWLKNQLSVSKAQWKIVYFHNPPFSSSLKHGSNKSLQWDFEQWGVTAVISGHVHAYERILRDDNLDNIQLPYFTVGLGGVRTLYKFSEQLVDGSHSRYNFGHGALIVDANENRIEFRFYSIEKRGRLIDSYTILRD